MGLYDNFKINLKKLPIEVGELALLQTEYDLRDGFMWQTKSLGCEMAGYLVADDGALTVNGQGEGWSRTNDFSDTEFHGDVYFYTNIKDAWFEFRARFSDGKLSSVKRVDNVLGDR